MPPDKDELLEKARRFVLLERNRKTGSPEIALERRNPHQWAIVVDGFSEVVDKDLNVVSEPLPSNRSEDFISRTRFPFDEAWDLADAFIKKHILK